MLLIRGKRYITGGLVVSSAPKLNERERVSPSSNDTPLRAQQMLAGFCIANRDRQLQHNDQARPRFERSTATRYIAC